MKLNFLNGLTGHNNIAHLRLMLELRLNYLKLRKVEAYMQSEAYTITNRSEIHAELLVLKQEMPALEQEFTRLQTGFLKLAVIEEENHNRRHRLEILLQRTA